MRKVDLCVVTHNSLSDLRKFLEILNSDSENRPWKLYIADNGSTDGTVEWLKDNFKKYNIEHVDYNKNVGYSEACNALASYGSSDYLALCNADIWMLSSDVAGMIRSFEETGAAILGPKQRDEKGKVTHGGIFGTNTRPKFRGWQQFDPADEFHRDRVEAVTVSGSAYFVRRSVWEELTNDKEYRKIVPDAVGAFLPTYHYFEETFCSYLARHRGHKLMYDGTVSIGHKWHGSHEKGSRLDTEVVHESRAYFRTACDHLGIAHD